MSADRDEFAALLLAGERSGRRVVVVDECASTQDIAKEHATKLGAGSDVVVVARRQTAGRGRLGRTWADTVQTGLAMSLTLDAGSIHDAGVLSLGVGLGACEACERVMQSSGAPNLGAAEPSRDIGTVGARDAVAALGLRWPNDVVERSRGRKLAGVLIERSADVFIIGVGINVLQREGDWPEALRGRAASLLELEPRLDGASLRGLAAAELLGAIERVLAMPADRIARGWSCRDTLVGTRRAFEHGGTRIVGIVEAIDPLSHLIVRDDGGSLHRLPALSTSMVHDDAP
ncbi:MAG: biotin--[acetyl-CoA-carboxylase] ligase [Phycisphaerae bacterium]|nr:biotin--[acetyl-CoA-carboxylase] ligase [Phycisphaerae bacterium]